MGSVAVFLVSLFAITALMIVCAIAADVFRRPRKVEEYQEYASNNWLERIWFNEEAIDYCSNCGCSDVPVLAVLRQQNCKWCQELKNLNYHLKMNGQRRFTKEMRKEFWNDC